MKWSTREVALQIARTTSRSSTILCTWYVWSWAFKKAIFYWERSYILFRMLPLPPWPGLANHLRTAQKNKIDQAQIPSVKDSFGKSVQAVVILFWTLVGTEKMLNIAYYDIGVLFGLSKWVHIWALNMTPVISFESNKFRYQTCICLEAFWLTPVDAAQLSQPQQWHIWSGLGGRHGPSSIVSQIWTRKQL